MSGLRSGGQAGAFELCELGENGPLRPDERLDTVGFFCPIPIIKTGARMRGMEEGEILEVISDDRVILVDLPNWCRGGGHEYLGHSEAGREIHLFVRKGARKTAPGAGKARDLR